MADIHHPHDRLFRAVFADVGEAAKLLQATLPAPLRTSLAWPTLTLRRGTFVDEDLRASEADLLYRVDHVATGTPVSLYLLLEHQSAPDPWLRLRLLRYCCRIWEADRQRDPGRVELRPIVPVVFYQGRRGWTASPEFAELFPAATRAWPWVPRFAHELLDQTTLAPQAVAGGLEGRITQLLLMAAADRHLAAALELTAELFPVLRQRGGAPAVRRFVVYLLETQEAAGVATFRAALQRQGLEEGEALMSYAQELLAEGEAKGRAEGRAEGEAKGRLANQVEVVEGFLRAGVSWTVIEAATGLTEAGFQALKAQLTAAGS